MGIGLRAICNGCKRPVRVDLVRVTLGLKGRARARARAGIVPGLGARFE